MSDVFVPPGDSAQDTAVLLLEAAEKAGEPADVVRSSDGGFVVPKELADAAGVDYDKGDDDESDDEPEKKPAKKAAAKKSSK